MQIPEEAFLRLVAEIRTSVLLGAAAADALEAAAGMRGPSTPQGKASACLRGEVAVCRGAEDEPKKPRKKIGGFSDEVDEIPELDIAETKSEDGCHSAKKPQGRSRRA